MLALWSCGRRVSVVQAQRQIHRALRAAFTIAETVVRTIAERPALAVPSGHTSIGRQQQQLVDIADKPVLGETAKPASPTLEQFLSGLRTAWKGGRGTPDQRSKSEAPATTASARSIRGSDDFVKRDRSEARYVGFRI